MGKEDFNQKQSEVLVSIPDEIIKRENSFLPELIFINLIEPEYLFLDQLNITESKDTLLRERLSKKGFNPDNFTDYPDSLARGTAQAGGFGIGLERFIARSLGGINVRLIIPFPKTSELILG